jgi:DNA-binding CsgD family transcriptional regulator
MDNLMNLINNGNLPSGSAILWDEAGIDASNRNWQGLINKLINFLLQTFRHKRLILIMTVPYTDFLDSNTRKLFHAEILTQSIDYANKVNKTKPQLIQYNPRNRKFYYKYLRIRTEFGTAPLKRWNITICPQWLLDSYEELKNEFTRKLNKDIEIQIRDSKVADKRKPLTEIQEKTLMAMAKLNSISAVAKIVELTEKTVYFHLAQAKKKGYLPEEFT